MTEPGLLVRHDPAVRTSRWPEHPTDTRFHPRHGGGRRVDGFTSRGPTDHVKLSFDARRSRPRCRALAARDYDATRAFRRRQGRPTPQLDLDFYSHASGGPATAWAPAARSGGPAHRPAARVHRGSCRTATAASFSSPTRRRFPPWPGGSSATGRGGDPRNRRAGQRIRRRLPGARTREPCPRGLAGQAQRRAGARRARRRGTRARTHMSGRRERPPR